ncbi:cytidine deaminase [Legionella sp. km772]|uniref:cytidine deaminase n=1 Tax=Legionella sp. km772 TaxID=2498111 RepID=UPI000F8F22DC|nr:cytidine deaminase [Legionella sp. km772]RUR12295.1 cytidine deaminase [Legionella sp. km772]
MDKIITKMIANAHSALANAYAPYSKFTVAACICTDKGNLYTGVNVENGSYGLTSCAEASAICTMVSSGEQRIKSVVVLAGNNKLCPPCGSCRQKIYEFSSPETLIYLCDKNSILRSIRIDELLPLAFDFKP